jgi:low temperature requirement protein LtrA
VIRFLVSVLAWFVAAAIGLPLANVLLSGMHMDVSSYIEAVVIFGLLQGLFSLFALRMARRRAPALLGGAGLVSSFVALLVTDLVSSGLTIDGVGTWVGATLILWIVSMAAAFLLPLLLLRHVVDESRERRGR